MSSLRKFFVAVFIILAFIFLQSQSGGNRDSRMTFPPEISAAADSFRKADDLANWLYTYSSFLNQGTLEYLPLLQKIKNENNPENKKVTFHSKRKV